MKQELFNSAFDSIRNIAQVFFLHELNHGVDKETALQNTEEALVSIEGCTYRQAGTVVAVLVSGGEDESA